MTTPRQTITLIVLSCAILAVGCHDARSKEEQQAADRKRQQLLNARTENLSSALAALDQGDPDTALELLDRITMVDARYEGLDEARERALAMQKEAAVAREEAELLSRIDAVPISRVREVRELYFQLWRLRPDNKEYQAKYLSYSPNSPRVTPVLESEDEAREASLWDLEIEQWSWRHDHGYLVVNGRIKNLTGRRLPAVEAVVEFFTQSGEFVKSATAPVEYSPVMPGQTSPFRIITRDNPEIRTAKVSFKNFGGAKLESYERE
ncbi:MAG: FxLYD domain-containing protein [Thermoanaerobaculia bacterium]|nr:FxLYD domain-containing protein [Thermoanaerobaculia bacterium]